jgi:signal transduction histidine kinase
MPVEKSPGRVSARPFIELGGRQYLGQRVPVVTRFPKTAQGSLVVLYEKERWRSGIRQAAYPALIAGISAALAAMVLTAALARRLVRPVQQLGRETSRIAQGHFQPVAVPPRNDEIRDLALAINGMAEKLGQYERDVRNRERLRTLGQLGAGMAHQLRNSATGARMAIELHRRQCVRAGDDESLGVALRQLRLMESYLQRFLRVGRDHRLNPRDVDLAEIVAEVLDLVRPTCVHGKIELGFRRPAERLIVHGDADSLRDLVTNVVLNAIEAAKRPGEELESHGGTGTASGTRAEPESHESTGTASGTRPPRVSVELEPLGVDRAVVRVKDSGAGPSAATRENLFEPLVSEKPEGAGLGLFVARQVAEAHHGSIAWQRLGEMTCFSIELPRIATGADDGTPAGG